MWENCHDYDPEIERELRPRAEDVTRPKPCPFCFPEYKIKPFIEQSCEADDVNDIEVWNVWCNNPKCGAVGPGAPTEAEAIAMWNAAPRKGDDGD